MDLTKWVSFYIEMPYGQVPILEFNDAQGNMSCLETPPSVESIPL
jgi:hypothetical protein